MFQCFFKFFCATTKGATHTTRLLSQETSRVINPPFLYGPLVQPTRLISPLFNQKFNFHYIHFAVLLKTATEKTGGNPMPRCFWAYPFATSLNI